jgi:protein phosphatase
MRTSAAGVSDVGLQRDHNEDCFTVLKEYELYVVADGMGGHRAGDVASRLATDAIAEFFKRTAEEELTWPFQFDATLSEEENRLLTAVRLANRQIHEHSTRSHDLRGMGTTVVGAMLSFDRRKIFIAHVGDSRAYRVRNGRIEQLTRDHSLLNDYLSAMPDMTDEQRGDLPRNVITRALGMQENVEVDIQAHPIVAGDAFLLCSDGLSGMVNDDEMLAVIRSVQDPEEACRRLIGLANEHGGEDNITAVVVRTAADSPGELATTDATMPFVASAAGPLSTTQVGATDATMPMMPVPTALRGVDAMAKTPPGGVQAISTREVADTLPGEDQDSEADGDRNTEPPPEPQKP